MYKKVKMLFMKFTHESIPFLPKFLDNSYASFKRVFFDIFKWIKYLIIFAKILRRIGYRPVSPRTAREVAFELTPSMYLNRKIF